MKKRIISAICAAAMIMSAAVMPAIEASAETFTYGDSVTTTGYRPDQESITIEYYVSSNSVDISWTALAGAEKYAICGCNDGYWQMLAITESTDYTLNKLKADTEYKLAIIAMFDGVWNMDFSNYFIIKTKAAETHVYPTLTSIDYNKDYHQFRLNWTAVPYAQNYGIAVYLSGKWKIQTQSIPGTTTSFTSPKLTRGKSYKMLIAAKVGRTWDLTAMTSRTFMVTVM